MKCPECVEAGMTSCVYPNVSSVTGMYVAPFYDEEGAYHQHDANTTTTDYSCSNGHSWTETATGSCWCGWPNNEAQR